MMEMPDLTYCITDKFAHCPHIDELSTENAKLICRISEQDQQIERLQAEAAAHLELLELLQGTYEDCVTKRLYLNPAIPAEKIKQHIKSTTVGQCLLEEKRKAEAVVNAELRIKVAKEALYQAGYALESGKKGAPGEFTKATYEHHDAEKALEEALGVYRYKTQE